MKLIIGLGNPGTEYAHTRHNVGFLLADFLQQHWNFPAFTPNKKFSADISEGLQGGEKILLVKPTTFMNNSGELVQALINFYKLAPTDIFVIQDELDIPFGTYRIATDSSAAGHNGIKNIIERLGTQQFTRLRIGIGTSEQSTACLRDAHTFVLNRFTTEEESALEKLFPILEQAVNTCIERK